VIEIGDTVVCTLGINKGKEFIVETILKNGFYSCRLKDKSDEKYYQYDSNNLEKVSQNR